METSYPQPPPLVPAIAITNVRTWTALCHASALLGVFIYFPGHLLAPLIVWLMKRDESPEMKRTARKPSTSRSRCSFTTSSPQSFA